MGGSRSFEERVGSQVISRKQIALDPLTRTGLTTLRLGSLARKNLFPFFNFNIAIFFISHLPNETQIPSTKTDKNQQATKQMENISIKTKQESQTIHTQLM